MHRNTHIQLILDGLSTRGGTEDGSEEWGYIPLRPGASMFYWFYRATHPDGYLNRPIVLWLQGGPGYSGTGLGSFLEIGPLDQYLQPRNPTWLESVNLLFVDSPVGCGFSMVNNKTLIPDDKDGISADLVTMLQIFMKEHSDLQETPFFIFGQSYGGSMAVSLGQTLQKAIDANEIKLTLKGIGIGSSCLSQTDAIKHRPNMLYMMSLIDHSAYIKMNATAFLAYEAGERQLWGSDYMIIGASDHNGIMPCMSVYNIMDLAPVDLFPYPNSTGCSEYNSIYSLDISDVMNGKIRHKLKIIPDDVNWISYNQDVFYKQINSADFFKPTWQIVDDLLINSELDIVVYQGQLDFICNAAGTLGWIQRLTWPGLSEYNSAKRYILTNPSTNVPEMFVKYHDRFTMYWVLNSGHVVPADVPDVALKILHRTITGE